MVGETNLSILIGSMEPALDEQPYGFVVDAEGAFPLSLAFATIREDEGVTIIAAVEAIQGAGIEVGPKWAKVTLTVHSSLEAVGLTAAFAGALKDAGISANVVAGFHHDHIFVPWPKRQDALEVLRALSQSERMRIRERHDSHTQMHLTN
jgi:uncharacterized protein